MLLAVDVGNSHTVSGVFRKNKLIAKWRLKSDRDRTADELAIRYHSLFQLADIQLKSITGFVLASVVPTLTTAWLSYVDRYLAAYLVTGPVIVSHTTKTTVRIDLPSPAEVGADRIVNVEAACEILDPPLIVIDFGTAITFDCVTAGRCYVGGAILPGISISLDALSARTARLPRVAIDQPLDSAIGTTTVDAIRSGLLNGFGGMVDRMVERLAPELAPVPGSVSILGTGGMASVIAPYCSCLEHVDTDLTLKGLFSIHRRLCE